MEKPAFLKIFSGFFLSFLAIFAIGFWQSTLAEECVQPDYEASLASATAVFSG